MKTSGVIVASVDTDHANIESWNRWYDLEHLPPNIALDGIMTGRRYVAPPRLHDIRLPFAPLDGFAEGRGVNLTVYTLCGDPAEVITEMTRMRDHLEASGRMEGAGRRVVRFGDAMTYRAGAARPALGADLHDVPHVAHTGLRLVLRRRDDPTSRAARGAIEEATIAALAVDGVLAVMRFDAVFAQGLAADIHLLEGDTADVTSVAREAAPYPDDAGVVLDAPFDLVVPFDYSFAERIRASELPASID